MATLSQYIASLTTHQRACLEARLWSKVDRRGPDECWPWTAGFDKDGYGQIRLLSTTRRAHSLASELTYGPIPDGVCVCHSCDVRYPVGSREYRKCCNPAHLWRGTSAQNSADMVAKERQATGDRNGARLHPDRLARGDRSGSRLHPETRARGARNWVSQHPESSQGVNNGRAKLNDMQVFEIRRAYAAGGVSLQQLGTKFGVSKVMVGLIVRRIMWKHLA